MPRVGVLFLGCPGLPKLVANIGSQFQHFVNIVLADGWFSCEMDANKNHLYLQNLLNLSGLLLANWNYLHPILIVLNTLYLVKFYIWWCGSLYRTCWSLYFKRLYLYPRPTKLEGGYTGFTFSVRLSVRPSVCRRHGFRSISQVCFGISISNFICMLMVAIGRSLLIFSDVTFKMAAWWPYCIFWFPDSNFTLALNINFKLQRHNTYVYG